MSIERLIDAAAKVDVIDCAGRIIANPERHAPSASNAEVLALALALEAYWSIVVDAEVLVRALKRPFFSGDDAADQDNDHRIARSSAAIREKLALIRAEAREEQSHE